MDTIASAYALSHNRKVNTPKTDRPSRPEARDIVELRVTHNPQSKLGLWLECVTAHGGEPVGRAFTHHNLTDFQQAGIFLLQIVAAMFDDEAFDGAVISGDDDRAVFASAAHDGFANACERERFIEREIFSVRASLDLNCIARLRGIDCSLNRLRGRDGVSFSISSEGENERAESNEADGIQPAEQAREYSPG